MNFAERDKLPTTKIRIQRKRWARDRCPDCGLANPPFEGESNMSNILKWHFDCYSRTYSVPDPEWGGAVWWWECTHVTRRELLHKEILQPSPLWAAIRKKRTYPPRELRFMLRSSYDSPPSIFTQLKENEGESE